jgi:hypothetical protein
MAVVDQRTPPPSLEQLRRLQLMRTSLVNFIEWKNFDTVVSGCYVRVLLEMRSEDRQRDNTIDNNNNYYITCVKGAKRGPPYAGFSCDGGSTEWHILIELPPCFRATTNGNVVQLNSISNSAFLPQEYQTWVNSSREAKQPFPTLAALDFRYQLLQEHKLQAMTPAVRKRKTDEDPAITEQREQRLQALKESVRQEINETYTFFPHVDRLKNCTLEELQDVERNCLDVIGSVRIALNEKSKCVICTAHASTVVCYPCKHQVVCKECIDRVQDTCPAPGCGSLVTQKFEAYTA